MTIINLTVEEDIIYNHYKTEIHNVSLTYKKDINDLRKKFAFINNPHKIGDIISDKHITIEIKEIDYCYIGTPKCIYRGIKLINHQPVKDQSNSIIYQTDIIDNSVINLFNSLDI